MLDVAPDEHFARTCEILVRYSERSSGRVVHVGGSLIVVKVPIFYKKALRSPSWWDETKKRQ